MCCQRRENLVQVSNKQENQARIITFVNNLYQNYQVSLNYLLIMIRQQSSLTNRLTHQSTTLMMNSSRTPKTSGPTLMRGLNVHENIPVSITKLTLGLQVGFISSHLIVDKLFIINPSAITGPPKMSLLLEAKKRACIDHQTKVCLCYAHG